MTRWRLPALAYLVMPVLQILLFLLLGGVAGAETLKPPISVAAPAKGVLLVADRTMPDRRFQRTVILILEHDAGRGTLGLVLNRPTDVTLDQIMPDSGFRNHPMPINWGGPVAQNNLFMLFQANKAVAGSLPLASGLFWSASPTTLAALQQSGYDETTLLLFIGAAGWAPGQLDNELGQDSWKLFAIQTGAVFHNNKDNPDNGDALWHHFVDAPVQIMAAK